MSTETTTEVPDLPRPSPFGSRELLAAEGGQRGERLRRLADFLRSEFGIDSNRAAALAWSARAWFTVPPKAGDGESE